MFLLGLRKGGDVRSIGWRGIPSGMRRSVDCCREIKIYDKIENPDLMTRTKAASEQSSHHRHGERNCRLSSGHSARFLALLLYIRRNLRLT